MQYFTRLSRLLLAGVGLTLALPAFAAGTDAGLLVTNSVTLDYQVNGGDQPQQTDSIDFTVDLRLDVLVGAVDADWISATIGQEVTGVPPLTGVPALNFLVSNNSNADVDVVLGVVGRGAVDITGFTNDPGATSTGVDGVIVAIDDGSATYEEGVDTVLTPTAGVYSLPAALAQDDSVNILVVADIAAGAANGDYEAFSLVAAVATAPGVAYERDESGNLAPGGAGPTDVANALGGDAQPVFADFQATFDPENFGFNFLTGSSSGAVDVLYDGQSSDTSGYAITGVDVLVAKYAEVIFDPVSGNKYTGGAPNGAEPKAIPGAVIMYVVGVANQDTAFSADNISVVDDIPDGAGPVELVDEGNLSGTPVNLPTLVTVDFDTANPGANTEDFTLTGVVTDQSLITSSSCSAVPVISEVAFDADIGPDTDTNPEVVVNLGTCDADSEGFIVYFVTVETNG